MLRVEQLVEYFSSKEHEMSNTEKDTSKKLDALAKPAKAAQLDKLGRRIGNRSRYKHVFLGHGQGYRCLFETYLRRPAPGSAAPCSHFNRDLATTTIDIDGMVVTRVSKSKASDTASSKPSKAIVPMQKIMPASERQVKEIASKRNIGITKSDPFNIIEKLIK